MFLTLFVATLLVALSVMVHYEVVYRIFIFMPSRSRRPRLGVIWVILLALIAHIIEILIFAAGYYGLIFAKEGGTFVGALALDLKIVSITLLSPIRR